MEVRSTDLQPWLSSSRTPLSLRSGYAFSVLMISCTSFSPSSCSMKNVSCHPYCVCFQLLHPHRQTDTHHKISRGEDLPGYLRCCLQCWRCKASFSGPATSSWCRRTVSSQNRASGSSFCGYVSTFITQSPSKMLLNVWLCCSNRSVMTGFIGGVVATEVTSPSSSISSSLEFWISSVSSSSSSPASFLPFFVDIASPSISFP